MSVVFADTSFYQALLSKKTTNMATHACFLPNLMPKSSRQSTFLLSGAL